LEASLEWCTSVLFPIFINDLDNGLLSNVLKFADDTKLYCSVNNQMDGLKLQRNLDTVSSRAKRWQMEFNVSNCKVFMHYGKKNTRYNYSMNGQLIMLRAVLACWYVGL